MAMHFVSPTRGALTKSVKMEGNKRKKKKKNSKNTSVVPLTVFTLLSADPSYISTT